MMLAMQAQRSVWLETGPERRDEQIRAVVAALVGIKPADELEGMIAAQLVACHNAAMECYRRAMLTE
jgi:hypothetical protein